MNPKVKICGIRDPEALDAAVAAGADMVGFVFVEASVRAVMPAEARGLAARLASPFPRKVALLVDADDALVDAAVDAIAPDILQLHGQETPARVAEIRRRAATPIMKAVGIAAAGDVARLTQWRGLVDHLLVDAKPPADATVPGGHGRTFDWSLLDGCDPRLAFMLSGGLDPDNVAEALRRTGACGVDVSSGVERAPGVKDRAKIHAFVRAARTGARAS